MQKGGRKPRRSLWAGSVWDPAIAAEFPERSRSLYTVALPAVYVSLTLFGGLGLLTFVTPVARLTSIDYADLWTAMVGMTAALSLGGLIARRPALELYSLIALCVGFATYPISVLIQTLSGQVSLAPLAVVIWSLLALPLWRVADLFRTVRKRNQQADD